MSRYDSRTLPAGFALDDEALNVLHAYAAREIGRAAAAVRLHVTEDTITKWCRWYGLPLRPGVGARRITR